MTTVAIASKPTPAAVLSRRGALAAALTVAVAALGTAPARAHDTWLLPDQPKVDAGQPVTFAITSGMAFPAEETAIDDERVARSAVRLAGAQEPFAGQREGERALHLSVVLARTGIATAWVELRPRSIELTPDQVSHYVEEIGAPAEVLARWQAMPEPRRWREAYRKHTKTFVRVGEAAEDRSWSEPVGSPVELVPEQDPTALTAGDELTILLLRGGAPAAGANVALVHAGGERAVVRATDAGGRVTFPLARAGWYLIRSTHLRPADAADLEWEADFATLTVRVGERTRR